MPCRDAIVPNPILGHTGQSVQELLTILEENHIRTVPVVDDDNVMRGIFGFEQILKGLLPVSATMEDGLQTLDFVVGAAPGIAKRLRKLYPKKVEEVMKTDCPVVYPDTPSWEAVRLMVRYGSPIPVLEEETGAFIGIISEQSLLEDFKRIIKDMEDQGVFDRKDAEEQS